MTDEKKPGRNARGKLPWMPLLAQANGPQGAYDGIPLTIPQEQATRPAEERPAPKVRPFIPLPVVTGRG